MSHTYRYRILKPQQEEAPWNEVVFRAAIVTIGCLVVTAIIVITRMLGY